jgi:hypothetical protein
MSLTSRLVDELKVQADIKTGFPSKSKSKVNEAFEQEKMNERRLFSHLASLSSTQERDRCHIEELLSKVESLDERMKGIERGLLKEGEDSKQVRATLEALKVSVSKLIPPRQVGGLRNEETIHITVPGCCPLSEGIISHLSQVIGGHVCDHQRVHAFSDSVCHASCLPWNAADFTTTSRFQSKNEPNQSFGYDFKDNQLISPTHYAIRSFSGDPGSYHPKSWVIEVTNDRSKEAPWIEIDRRENNEDLNGRSVVQTFRCSTPRNDEFRYIRMRQIGANHNGSDWLIFEAFEVFGQLRVKNSVPM